MNDIEDFTTDQLRDEIRRREETAEAMVRRPEQAPPHAPDVAAAAERDDLVWLAEDMYGDSLQGEDDSSVFGRIVDAIVARVIAGLARPAAVPFEPQTIVVHPTARSDMGPFTLHLFQRDEDADDWHTEHGGWIQLVTGGVEWHPATEPTPCDFAGLARPATVPAAKRIPRSADIWAEAEAECGDGAWQVGPPAEEPTP